MPSRAHEGDPAEAKTSTKPGGATAVAAAPLASLRRAGHGQVQVRCMCTGSSAVTERCRGRVAHLAEGAGLIEEPCCPAVRLVKHEPAIDNRGQLLDWRSAGSQQCRSGAWAEGKAGQAGAHPMKYDEMHQYGFRMATANANSANTTRAYPAERA